MHAIPHDATKYWAAGRLLAPTKTVGLSGVAGVLPARHHDLQALAHAQLLRSSPEALSEFGFERAHVCDGSQTTCDLALHAANAALRDAGLRPEEVDLLIWASARPENHLRVTARDERPHFMDGFRYAAGWLQEELGLHNAETLAVAQQGCSTMFSALRVARSLLLAEPRRRHALCVGVDALPAGAPREIAYNVISDAACAVVVSRGCGNERWLGYRQISRGSCWDPASKEPEILAAYFPVAKRVIEELLDEQGLGPADIDVVVPTGVNHASWDILLRIVGIPRERLYRGSVEPFGHTILADNFLYLEDLRRSGRVPHGAKVLLFTYGFGSSWCALLLEH